MDEQKQIYSFADDIDALVKRYGAEFDLSYAAIIGVLQMKIHTLCNEAEAQPEDE